MNDIPTPPMEIPPLLYGILAIALAVFYSWFFPKVQEWMVKRAEKKG